VQNKFNIRKYFITGLVILLPVAMTIAIVIFIFNLLTAPFLGITQAVFDRYHLFSHGFLFLTASQVQSLVAQLLILTFLFFFVVGLGFIARWFFFKTVLLFTEYIVKRIPFVSSIYKTCQEVINTLFTSNKNSFKQVVLVKFPNAISYSIGLITSESNPCFDQHLNEKRISVFVPTAPNPTSGFLMLFKAEDLIYIDMKVEDAFKFIISCGMISPEFNELPVSKDIVNDEKTKKYL
jgi:uncharacterized membrane protein